MSSYFLLQLFLTVGLLVLICFIILVLIQFYRTLRRLEELIGIINKDMPSILDKLQLALNGVNSEIGKIEDLVASLNDVSATVRGTAELAKRAMTSPYVKAAGLAAGAGTVLSRLVRRDKKE